MNIYAEKTYVFRKEFHINFNFCLIYQSQFMSLVNRAVIDILHGSRNL